MAPRKKKAQISVYLDPETMGLLADYAARRDQPQSLIAEAAIASFLSPDAAEQREAAVAKRLDQLDQRMARLERDLSISVETLVVFVRFWLSTTPTLPEPAAQATRQRREGGMRRSSRRWGGGSRRGRGWCRRSPRTAVLPKPEKGALAPRSGSCRCADKRTLQSFREVHFQHRNSRRRRTDPFRECGVVRRRGCVARV